MVVMLNASLENCNCDENVPLCILGPYRAAMRLALVEATSETHVQRVRGWKLFLFCCGLVSQEKLHKMFVGGRWEEILRDGEAQEATAAILRRRRRWRSDNVHNDHPARGNPFQVIC